MNNKGFSLVELMAVIAILGIVTAIITINISDIVSRSKNTYLTSQEKMIVLAAKNYYADYRSKLPKNVGLTATVYVYKLVELNYIDPVKDKDGTECDRNKQSKVVVQKIGKSDYHYEAYLECGKNKYGVNDTEKPTVKLNPSLVEDSEKAVNVKLEATDNIKVLSYRYIIEKDGEEYKDSQYKIYKKPVNIKLVHSGEYTITAYAYDGGGNAATPAVGKYKITIKDPDCKTFGVTSNPAGSEGKWVNKDVTLTIKVPLDGNSLNTWSLKDAYYDNAINKRKIKMLVYKSKKKTLKVKLSDNGEHTLDFLGYNVSNISCSSIGLGKRNLYKIDKEVPVINRLNNGSKGKWTNEKVTITLNGSDKYSGIERWEYSLNNKIWTKFSSEPNTATISFSDEMDETIYFRVYDTAGNVSKVSSTKVRIDLTPPGCTSSGGFIGGKEAPVTISGKCSDRGGSMCKKEYKDISKEFNDQGIYSRSPGTVYDNAGNYFECPEVSFIIDNCEDVAWGEPEYGPCSKKCGGGKQTVTDSGPSNLPGSGRNCKKVRDVSCNTQACVIVQNIYNGDWIAAYECRSNCNNPGSALNEKNQVYKAIHPESGERCCSNAIMRADITNIGNNVKITVTFSLGAYSCFGNGAYVMLSIGDECAKRLFYPDGIGMGSCPAGSPGDMSIRKGTETYTCTIQKKGTFKIIVESVNIPEAVTLNGPIGYVTIK